MEKPTLEKEKIFQNKNEFNLNDPIIEWWETEWFKEWEKLSKRDYHGKIPGH